VASKSKKTTADLCEEVKRHFNDTASAIKTEVMPQIESLKRDHVLMKQDMIELQKRVFDDLIPSLKDGIGDIGQKLDKHIETENQKFDHISSELSKAASHVETIQFTLDNVSANGNKGLSASMSDVYSKLRDLESLTEGPRNRAKFWAILHQVVNTTPFLKPLKYKWGAIFYFAILMLIINTILHSLGVDFNLVGIWKWLIKTGSTLV